ncbi:hypothetical protein EDD16DRAFT_1600648 [Pisolithus croceorrhizus]|nr:hypothetical protein EDD16DRAFT_1600648 [Pisolithus croceorrhizus]KAI6134366.1 hypothetical protein EV401DRAFT_1908261 [Pisolithus croceorrhizus]
MRLSESPLYVEIWVIPWPIPLFLLVRSPLCSALSTEESRRRTVFRLNALAICLALTTSVLGGTSSGKAVVTMTPH